MARAASQARTTIHTQAQDAQIVCATDGPSPVRKLALRFGCGALDALRIRRVASPLDALRASLLPPRGDCAPFARCVLFCGTGTLTQFALFSRGARSWQQKLLIKQASGNDYQE